MSARDRRYTGTSAEHGEDYPGLLILSLGPGQKAEVAGPPCFHNPDEASVPIDIAGGEGTTLSFRKEGGQWCTWT